MHLVSLMLILNFSLANKNYDILNAMLQQMDCAKLYHLRQVLTGFVFYIEGQKA